MSVLPDIDQLGDSDFKNTDIIMYVHTVNILNCRLFWCAQQQYLLLYVVESALYQHFWTRVYIVIEMWPRTDGFQFVRSIFEYNIRLIVITCYMISIWNDTKYDKF